MAQRRWQFPLILPALGLALFLAGCPKRPATTAATAPPAPTPMAAPPAAMAPAAPGGAAPGAMAPGAMAPGAMAPGAPRAAMAPTAPAPPPREFMTIAALKDIHFDFDKYNIRPSEAKILEENVGWMKANPTHLILVEGHADERGTNEYNLALGERRAKSTMDHLVSLGIQAGRITLISYGEERPLCTDKNEDCWTKNRRAHFLVKPR